MSKCTYSFHQFPPISHTFSIPLWMPRRWLRGHFIKPSGLWNAWTTWNSVLNARTKQEIFIKCLDKTRNPYKMQTRHFLVIFLKCHVSTNYITIHEWSIATCVLIKCQNLSSQILTFIKTHTFIKCLNRVPNILKNGAQKKKTRAGWASLYKMPTSLVTYSDFCQEETFIKCWDYMKTFPIMNLSATNQHSFYKMLSLRNVETPDGMQH